MKNKKFVTLLNKYPQGEKSLLISLLQETQELFGYLPDFTLEKISEHLNVSLSQIYGVVTFYAQFYLKPHGKYTIKTCQGTACHVKGSPVILETIQNELKIKPGETTKDLKFSLEVVYCLGTCFLAPVMMINNQYYGKLAPNKIRSILKSY
ncbi:MAG: NADH-quinone oxidoreductase subunit NuoE [Candidatus Firestonebacteria bacterium]